MTKAKLEGLFADELALLQPTPGYMRLLKESVLQIWKARKAAVRDEIANAERLRKQSKTKLDRLDEAFLFERSIDIETYDRQAEKLREELTLARIDRHSGQLEELDVEGILAFAERVLPRAADLWVQASLEQRQRFQQLFFPDGIAFDGNRFVGTRVTAPAFSYLREIETGNERMVDQSSASWNQIVSWLHEVDGSVERPNAGRADRAGIWSREPSPSLPKSPARAARLYAFRILKDVYLYIKVSDEPFEFGCLTQPFEMWIDPEERPTGETGVDAALQPRHGPVAVTEYCIHAGDLVVGVMRVAERTRQVERSANTLERRVALIAPRVQHALKTGEQGLVGQVL